ncbi:MAG: type II and III secretion system protein family protein [Blastocatellia bacterium]|nr:type II and III secretion system protein family protein [Blastocatellia bacterium]
MGGRICGKKFESRCRAILWLGIAALAVALPGRASALAQVPGMRVRFADIRQQVAELLLYTNHSVLLQFDETLQRVAISEPKIAEAVIVTPTQVLVNAKSLGRCTLIVWSSVDPDRPGFFQVMVGADVEPLMRRVRELFPSEKIAIELMGDRLVLSGAVSSEKVAERVAQLFDGTGLRVVNLLAPAPASTKQVLLQVRVAEVNRRALQELGANYTIAQQAVPAFIGTNMFHTPLGNLVGGIANMTFSDMVNLALFQRSSGAGAFIRALQSRNALRTLAEPNIIALNGQKASFLAGGEFPYPVVQGTGSNIAITIQFREFGVRLNFTPTIVEGDRIRLELEPEVSALDFTSGVTIAGTRIPGLVNRKAKTTVELEDGQSFALAGLLSNEVTRIATPIPGLSFLPILGYLFRSQRYVNNETELVFICTAHIVKPVSPEQLPPLPGQNGWELQGLEGFFGHRAPTVRREEKK